MKKLAYFLILSIFSVACDRNHAPVIVDVSCSPENRSAGTQFTLTVAATDEDGDKLEYRWSADGGEFPDSVNQVQVKWKSPADGSGKTFTIKVVVADAESEASREFQILLGAPQLGNLEGQVNYTNFKIPVDQANVTIGDKSSATDASGHFFISGIVVGDYDLKITKPAYTIFDSKIKITLNDTLQVNVEITSVNYTTKLSGLVYDPSGHTVGSARLVVLNPDGTESKLITTTNLSGFYHLWYIPFGKRIIVVTKPETNDTRFIDLKQTVEFKDVEAQLNLTIETLALSGQFTDPRDNHKYMYKTIGKVTWMTENLAYLPSVSPASTNSDKDVVYYVYGYQGTSLSTASASDNYKHYGVLYNWPAASSACPSGWHLPSSEVEWDSLTKPYGIYSAAKIKSTSGWSDHGNGDNSTGFTAIPGGYFDGSGAFGGIENTAFFWTSSRNNTSPIYMTLSSSSAIVSPGVGPGKFGSSVRCVRNN